MVEAEDNHDSAEKSEGVRSQLTLKDPEVKRDFLEEGGNEKAKVANHLVLEERSVTGGWQMWALRRLRDLKRMVCRYTKGGMKG